MANCRLLPLEFPQAPAPELPGRASREALRTLIQALERGGSPGSPEGSRSADAGLPAPVRPLGCPGLDEALPGGGLALGRMHEVIAPPDSGAAGYGFAMALLARILGRKGVALWCGRAEGLYGPGPYGPGLALFGIDAGRLVLVRAASGAEAMWVMEEALRCRSLGAVAGEIAAMDLVAGRRLQLACERHGVTALVVSRPRRENQRAPSAATTRWRVLPAPGEAAWNGNRARWRVELLRCRGGRPRDFVVDWNHATGDLAVAAAPAGRFDQATPQADAAD